MFTLQPAQVNKINSICRNLKLGNIDKFNSQWPVWLVVDILINRIEGLRTVQEAQAKQIKQLQTTVQNLENQIQNVARNAAVSSRKVV